MKHADVSRMIGVGVGIPGSAHCSHAGSPQVVNLQSSGTTGDIDIAFTTCLLSHCSFISGSRINIGAAAAAPIVSMLWIQVNTLRTAEVPEGAEGLVMSDRS